MPDWLQALNETNPIMHFITISKAVYLKDAPAELFIRHTWPMAVIALVTLTAGAWLFRRRVT
jgi:ABC-2 type transport system permease protein